jgi:hypothetical protein
VAASAFTTPSSKRWREHFWTFISPHDDTMMLSQTLGARKHINSITGPIAFWM